MRFRLELIVISVLLAVFGFALVSTSGWKVGPRDYAWAVGMPAVVLAGITIIQLLRRARKGTADKESTAGASPSRRVLVFFGWILAFAVGTWLFGFMVSGVPFVFSYVKSNGGSWWRSILSAGVFALFVWVFGLLQMKWIEGVVPRLLGL